MGGYLGVISVICRSFDTTFREEIKGLGITLEPSSPDTPEQNGHAERKGKMLAIKARALRIEAELPHYLWVKAIHTACYLANRTPKLTVQPR